MHSAYCNPPHPLKSWTLFTSLAPRHQTIIEAGSELHADLAAISIGRCCVIAQRVILRPPEHVHQGRTSFVPMQIGEHVVIERDSLVEAAQIGSFVHIGQNCTVVCLSQFRRPANVPFSVTHRLNHDAILLFNCRTPSRAGKTLRSKRLLLFAAGNSVGTRQRGATIRNFQWIARCVFYFKTRGTLFSARSALGVIFHRLATPTMHCLYEATQANSSESFPNRTRKSEPSTPIYSIDSLGGSSRTGNDNIHTARTA